MRPLPERRLVWAGVDLAAGSSSPADPAGPTRDVMAGQRESSGYVEGPSWAGATTWRVPRAPAERLQRAEVADLTAVELESRRRMLGAP